jgi:AraC-like DNA-binding protein
MIPIDNLYETLRSALHYNRFEIGKLLFVEYTCPIRDDYACVWTQTDYLVHVLSGKKTWHTPEGTWEGVKGDTLYVKKGASFVKQYFDDDFCLMLFFISDDFIKEIVRENSGQIKHSAASEKSQDILRVKNDVAISAFFQSMLTYFTATDRPSEALLKLKLKELIVSILFSQDNPGLSAYFQSLAGEDKTSLTQIMEANFCYNLSLDDFAKLCNRSLSSFKRDFKKHYNLTPGKWLLQKRVDYSAVLLKNRNLNVSQVCMECGFEDISHFSKVFKERFGVSPNNYRKKAA